jgi:hypothetical protein
MIAWNVLGLLAVAGVDDVVEIPVAAVAAVVMGGYLAWMWATKGAPAASQALSDMGKAIDRTFSRTKAESATQPCPPKPECKDAEDTFDRILNGRENPDGTYEKPIGQRVEEVKANPRNQPVFWEDAHPGVPRPRGSDQYGHLIQIEQQQLELIKALQSYYKNGCTNVPPEVLKKVAELVMIDPLDLL